MKQNLFKFLIISLFLGNAFSFEGNSEKKGLPPFLKEHISKTFSTQDELKDIWSDELLEDAEISELISEQIPAPKGKDFKKDQGMLPPPKMDLSEVLSDKVFLEKLIKLIIQKKEALIVKAEVYNEEKLHTGCLKDPNISEEVISSKTKQLSIDIKKLLIEALKDPEVKALLVSELKLSEKSIKKVKKDDREKQEKISRRRDDFDADEDMPDFEGARGKKKISNNRVASQKFSNQQQFAQRGQMDSSFSMPQMSQMDSSFSMPQMSQMNSSFNMPQMSQMNSNFNMPQMSQMNSNFNMPQMSQMNSSFNMPQMSQMNSNFNLPQMGQMNSNFNMPQMNMGYGQQQSGYQFNSGLNFGGSTNFNTGSITNSKFSNPLYNI